MTHGGFVSVVPILLTIGCALVTRKVILALFLGVLVGVLTLADGNLARALPMLVSDYLVVQLTDSYNAGVLVLLAFIGGFVSLMERSGGASAFATRVAPILSSRRRVEWGAWAFGVGVFFSDLGTPLIVGPIFEPLFDRWKISREKLAWIVDSTASPVAVVVPITGWAVYIMGLVRKELEALGLQANDWESFVAAIPFNFFSIVTVVLVPVAGFMGLEPAAMTRAESRTRDGERYWTTSKPLRAPTASAEESGGSVAFVWFPLTALFVTLFAYLAPHGFPFRQVPGSVFRAALSVAYLVAAVCLVTLMSRARVKSFLDSFDVYTEGIQKMMTVASILVLAWALGAVGRELGTAEYIISLAKASVPAFLVPALVFLVGAVMSFATGSSWGSFAIMLPLVVPLAHATGVEIPLATGAVLAGGLFGDHASPISDTTILSSTGAGCDHIDHVKTQLPYALAAAAASLVAYIGAGLIASPLWLVAALGLTIGGLALVWRRAPAVP